MVTFAPGPSELYFTVFDHTKRAFRDHVPSLSHRTKQFEAIFTEAAGGLRELLGLPAEFHVAFTSSATEIWERSIQNLVGESSFHLVNGAFSKRYAEISKQLGKRTSVVGTPAGTGFHQVTIPRGQEVIGITHNETSTGVSLTLDFIRSVRQASPDSLIVVDAVSSLPYPDFDYKHLDSVFFSVQKGFGLPAGLGVWIYNDRCLEKARQLAAKGQIIGTYHSLPSLYDFAKKNQTPSTPNVLSIYLLGKVITDFLKRGITAIRRETEYKATVLYQALDKRKDMEAFVKHREDRSKTVVTLSCPERIQPLRDYLAAKGFFPGDGYGNFNSSQLRFANFPAHSKEQYEALADALEQFE